MGHGKVKGADSLRNAIFQCVFRRWRAEPYCKLTILRPTHYQTGPDYQRERRIRAEQQNNREIFIVADDDCYIGEPEPIIHRCLEIMERHKDFAILSFFPQNFTVSRWAPENYAAYEDDEVMEQKDVGGIRVCRRGILKEYPPANGLHYDAIHCEAIRAAGYRVGYLKFKMLHLGEGHTTIREWDSPKQMSGNVCQ